MKLTFGPDTPLPEQLTRSWSRKKVGRKHDHRPGPTRKGRRREDMILAGKWKAYQRQVRFYFEGKRDTHPAPPTHPTGRAAP